jgi:hypothetical protein
MKYYIFIAAVIALVPHAHAAAPLQKGVPTDGVTQSCRDPHFYGASLSALKACRDEPPAQKIICLDGLDAETGNADSTEGPTAIQIEDAVHAYCRNFATGLTGLAKAPEMAVDRLAGMVAGMAWTVVPVQESQDDLWGKAGPVAATMTDEAYARFVRPRLVTVTDEGKDFIVVGEPWMSIVKAQIMQFTRPQGPATVKVEGLAWSWAGSLVGLRTGLFVGYGAPPNPITELKTKVVVNMTGTFDPNRASDVNPLGVVISTYSEGTQ